MKISNFTSYNNSFKGRNTDLKQADKILRKINKDFASSSPWHADYRATKARTLSEDMVATLWSTVKLNAFREAQESVVNKNLYKYATCLIEGIRRYKVANCKELAEIAFLIGKANGIEDCYCANLYLKDSRFKNHTDLEHSIVILNQKPYKNSSFADPYYDDIPKQADLIMPDDKSIVVDPMFGIVDYWKNAKNLYINSGFIKPQNNDELTIFIRKPIIESEKELKKLQANYPIISFDNTQEMCNQNKFDFRATDLALELYKSSATRLHINNNPPAEIVESPKNVGKNKTLLEKFRSMIS